MHWLAQNIPLVALSTFLLHAGIASAMPWRPVVTNKILVDANAQQPMGSANNRPSLWAQLTSPVFNTICIDPNAPITEYEITLAQLQICRSTPGLTGACQGQPTSTVGTYGRAGFWLDATEPGAAIVVGQDEWERCVAAARRACPHGSLVSTCIGGATKGDFQFRLDVVKQQNKR